MDAPRPPHAMMARFNFSFGETRRGFSLAEIGNARAPAASVVVTRNWRREIGDAADGKKYLLDMELS